MLEERKLLLVELFQVVSSLLLQVPDQGLSLHSLRNLDPTQLQIGPEQVTLFLLLLRQ